jgi:hypothetical protein
MAISDALKLVKTLTSTISKGPLVNERKYYAEDSIFNKDVTVSGNSITNGSALILGETAICGDTYLSVNPLAKPPKKPNLFVTGNIFGFARLLISKLSLFNGTVIINRRTLINSTLVLAGIGNVANYSLRTRIIAQSKKSFDIPHPSKDDYRLRYVCLEGPAAEVYIRGKLENQNTISLPEYWINLVDKETIGVTLTPIGYHQALFVEKIESESKIIIQNKFEDPINCYYTVTAERKDTPKNIPEYEGLTSNDYPGDNDSYSVNGL